MSAILVLSGIGLSDSSREAFRTSGPGSEVFATLSVTSAARPLIDVASRVGAEADEVAFLRLSLRH